MRKTIKRIFASVLTVAMLITAAPLSGFAGLDLPNLADLFTLKADAAAYSGECGDNLTWSLDTDTGVLTISGTGDMYNWDYYYNVPWYINRSSVKTVVIGDSVTSIGEYAFYWYTGLTSVTLGNSVTSIGYGSFENCTSLTSVTIPDSVISIGNYAFESCTSLTSVTIPDSVTSLGYRAFWECTGLTSITVDSNNTVYDSRENCNAIIETETNTLIQGCNNTIIPDGITSIGDYAFYSCTGLTRITIPDSVMSIGDWAFAECTGLTNITVDSNNTVYDSRENCNAIIETETNILIQGCKNTTIPDGVTSIGDGAFEYCTGLTSITIPDSVTSIGEYAFYCCTGLTSITIPDSVTSIGEYAFVYCTGLTSITIPDSITSIGEGAFEYCTGLTSITIPDSVTNIGWGAFIECTGLTSITVDSNNTVYDSRENCNAIIETETNTLIQGCKNTTIPDGIISIGFVAFFGCTGLISITIPDSVTSIDAQAFSYCTGLTSITIPDSVTSIGYHAFEGCTGLTSITIPESVTFIDSSAFEDCTNITDVYYTGSKSDWEKIAIYSGNECLTGATIHYNYIHEHSYEVIETIEATCTQRGYISYLCNCGDTYKDYTDPLGHDFDEWQVTTPATCTSTGVETRYCSRCEETETRELPVTAHNYSKVVTNPTCTEQGYTTYTCQCGDSYKDDYVNALGHDYHEVVTEPTCIKTGYTIYTCAVCGDTYKDNFADALGHTDGEWKVLTQSTFDAEGLKALYCSVCGEIIKTESIPKLEPVGKVNSVSVDDIEMNYKKSATLNTVIEVDEGVNYTVEYSSSNPSVAKVDENGNVYGAKKGSAEITVTVTDEYGNTVTDTCNVKVKYSFGQWLLVILLFGWIWY